MKVQRMQVVVYLTILLTPLIFLTAPTSAKELPSFLVDEPVVLKKSFEPLSAGTREYLTRQDGENVKIWAFFTDKGVFTKDQFDRKASEITFSEKVMKRRAKTGMDHIVFADLPVAQSYIDEIVSLGATFHRSSRWLNAASFNAPKEKVDEIAALPFVYEVRPVLTFVKHYPEPETIRGDTPPSNALAPDALDYGSSYAQLAQINVPAVHDKGYHGEGVTLAVFDTGFRKSHEVFASHFAEGRVIAEWDFVFDDSNTANEAEDWSNAWNHGTYTWSTSAGFKDGVQIGPAYKANIILAKTEDVRSETEVEEDNWVAALEWVDTLGADVVTSSLGYIDWYTYEDLDGNTATTTLAANTAASMGIVVCNAMGNEGSGTGTLIAPADAHDILAVGAVTSTGLIASFSSRGPTYDGRTKPEVCARGVSTACATAVSDASYGSASGTSLSTPLVAGAACLLIQARPTYPPELIRLALMETADNAASPDNTYGWGVINLDAALNWGANFYADATIGQGPLTVQFYDSSTISPTSWMWSFGDGDTSYAQNPSHTYTEVGVYDVSLTIGSAYGDITTNKPHYVAVLGDTATFKTDSAYAGDQVVISVDIVNTQELNQIIIPFKYESTPSFQITFDSVSLGSRTSYFEDIMYITFDPDHNKYTVRLTADNGGGSPPLPVGSGEVMKIYFTLDPYAFGGLSQPIDSTTGLYSLEFDSDYFDYEPVVYGGEIRSRTVIRGDADGNLIINVGDVTYLVAYLFKGGEPPVSIQAGDAQVDFDVNINDLTYMVDYLFRGGSPPPSP